MKSANEPNWSATVTPATLNATFSNYIEMTDIASDPDWSYSSTWTNSTSYSATATAVTTGMNGTVVLDNTNVFNGTGTVQPFI